MSDLRQQFNQITQSLLQIQSVRRKRIVVVNDRADMVEYYRLVLRSYEVESFLSGTQASARIAVDPPYLVITDWAQPEAGFELLEQLRRQHPTLPIVLLSGHVDLVPPSGIVYLPLLFGPDRLLEAVHSLIGGPALNPSRAR